MKNINNLILAYKLQKNNVLTTNCMDILEGEIDGVSNEDAISWIEGLLQNGCISGWVGSLIYYTQTIAFYDENKEDINAMLYETLEQLGLSIQELFGNRFDKEDPLCIEELNQNLLAWFAFEETIRMFSDYMENEPEDEDEETEED